MKKVVNPSEVAHLFANKNQSEARTATNNFYFNSSGLFSYGSHFCIAKHVENLQDQKALLFTTRTYSNTTAKHIRISHQATRHLNKIWCHSPNGSINENLNEFLKEAELCFYNVQKSKQQRTKIKAFSELEYIKSKVKAFSEFYSIDIQKDYPKLFEALNLPSFENIAEYREKAVKIAEAEKIARQKELKKQHAKNLNNWRKNDFLRLYTHDGYDYLKIRTDNGRILTSQGVEIPQKIAQIFYNQILSYISTGEPQIIGSKLLDSYEITEINKHFICVGCHKITIKEIKKMATSLNW